MLLQKVLKTEKKPIKFKYWTATVWYGQYELQSKMLWSLFVWKTSIYEKHVMKCPEYDPMNKRQFELTDNLIKL